MIISVGKRIKVAISDYEFSCDCATPGAVVVSSSRGEITLPGNVKAAERFCEAYMRTVKEPIDYVRTENA